MIFGFPSWIVIGVGMFACVVMLMTMLANLYRKAAPNEALVVYGFRGPRIIIGSGTVIFPVFENFRVLSLDLMSFTIKEVRDKNEYITNRGRPDIGRIKRDADVAGAEAERDTAIKRAQAQRESAVAKAQADQERVLAETLSMAKQSEAQRDLEIKKATYLETIKKQQAQADKAYEIQTNIMLQQVTAEAVKIQQIEKEQQCKVQQAKSTTLETEIIATVLKPGENQSQL